MRSVNKHKGFSLIEIMVGLAIGMISMIVIMQVYAVFEGRKRSTTGGSDAQTNGAISTYMIEREIRMAGFGLGASSYATCNTVFSTCDGNAACGGGTGTITGLSFASVIVTDGGANPDSITVQFFADPTLGTFRYPATTTITKPMPPSSSEVNVASTEGCTEGNLMLASEGGNCTLMMVTEVQAVPLKLQQNPGKGKGYNPPSNPGGWPAYSTGASLSCFAAAPNQPVFTRKFSIDTASRQLRKDDNTVTPPVTNELVAPEIFDLQAEYGIAPVGVAPANQVVNAWVPATVDSTGVTWLAPTRANVNRIKAVRIALVSRSPQYEKPDTGKTCATTSAPVTNPTMDSTATTVITGWSLWARFDTANYPADWKCYRYKIFETVVPLRNVLWGNV